MIFNNDWDNIIGLEFQKDYFNKIRQSLIKEYKTHIIYPKKKNILNALKITSFSDAKVVILGQDPYHGPNQSHGLCFSVLPGVALPPSLRNIFKELSDDINCEIPKHGYLENWAKQGVLLLNTILTVRDSQPGSHNNIGWQYFTDEIIRKLNEREKPLVFILWGNNAKSKKSLITEKRHLIIESVHPSPLSASRGFFGSKPFSKANEFLKSQRITPIDWRL